MQLPDHIMVTFDHRDALPRRIVDEIAAHGWPVAGPDAYPSAFMIGADLAERPLDRGELAAVTAIIEGMCALIETEADLGDAWDDGRECVWRGTIAVPGGEGAIEVEVGAPLWIPDVELDEGDALDARADDLLRGLAAQVGGERDVLDWSDMLSQHAIAYHHALLHELTPAALEDVLFSVVPRKVMAQPTDAPAIIAAARAWLAFAAELPEPGHAKALLAAMPADASQRLARRLADPRLFGPAKTLFAAGERAGFDMSSNEGIERFLATTGGRLPELAPPSAGRSTKPSVASTKAKAKARAKTAKKARKKTRAR